MALLNVHFYSDALGLSTSMNVLLPQPVGNQIGMGGVRDEAPPPVLYLLHGLSDDHSTWLRRTSIERYVAERNLAIVMPAVHRSFYTDMRYGGAYFTFVAEELPQIVARFFRVASGRENTFVAGLSMGGYGAFKLALAHPDRYAAAASLSGALDVQKRLSRSDVQFARDMTNVYGDPPVIPHKEDLFHLAPQAQASGQLPALYAVCGTEDFLYPDHVKFKAFAEKTQLPITLKEAPGVHDWNFWDTWIQDVLKWLPVTS